MSEFSLKDQLFNAEKVAYLGGLFAQADDGFDQEGYQAAVMSRLLEFELKERIDWIADCLLAQLPDTLEQSAPILTRALPDPLDPSKSDDDFGDFIFAPLGEVVVRLGLETPELALSLLEEITQRFSMEFAVRPFLKHWPDHTLSKMTSWAQHQNYHVRRLATEGSRPRLPWGMSVGLPLDFALPLLDILHADRTRYVTRSVANHLNDIAKKDPDMVLERLSKWRDAGRQDAKELDWITNHALRGLVKAGHAGAMTFLGFDPDAPIQANVTLEDATPKIGGALTFEVALTGESDQKVLVDYRIHFKRPSGKASAKTFKLKQGVLGDAGLIVSKTHKLKANASTFQLVAGAHVLDIMVNGRVVATQEFQLRD